MHVYVRLQFSYYSMTFHILWLELTSHLCVAFEQGTYFYEIGLGMLCVLLHGPFKYTFLFLSVIL